KKSGLQTLAEKGVTLVVTVDCGVTAVEEADFAKSLGIDMIITDHHECGDQLPDAVAVINPKRHDSQYPFPSLAGVGVAFKLICAAEGCNNTERLLDEYGDLVAVGTIADVMPVIGENRVLIKCGTEVIRSGSRPGLRALCEAAGADLSKLTSQNISFLLAPRLNAAGRLGCTDIAVGLLLTRSSHEAEHLSALLCEKNRERQALESKMYDEALGMLPPRADRPVVLAMYGWHQGVAGIVASRLAEKLGVPTVMICLSDGVGRGSCRSVHGFSLYSALEQCRDLLETFGGHDMAAGLTVTEENVPALAEKLGEIYAECRDSISPPGLDVDFEVINPDILSLQDVESLSMLEPFGSCNPTPVLCLRSVTVEAVTPISGGRHTKLRLSKSGTAFDSIFFSKTVEDIGLLPGDLADAAFTPQINEFRSRRTVQLLILDIVPAGIGGHTNG
ncbi:MAG: single-stranded-DNA-specific exonuclease RecJ, partial [Oscillospiraceae bacterium]|nr:single-stranded-DNA-specific exonuclease RecJ [Oscillospiraceae bacterium]